MPHVAKPSPPDGEPGGLESDAAPIPNPRLEEQEEGRQLKQRHEEPDSGRHGIDRSRPGTFVRKSR
jgi:hypothetical protein